MYPPTQQGQYPQYQQGQYPQQEVNSHLVWSILNTICCCLPLGIYAIICSAKVSTLVAQGRIAEAQAKAKEAKKWNLISLIIAIIGFVLSVIFSALS
jgi:heme/copper-type cytochrome/quinol oxidase subunit 2